MIYYLGGTFFTILIVGLWILFFLFIKNKFRREIENYKIQRIKNAYIKNSKIS